MAPWQNITMIVWMMCINQYRVTLLVIRSLILNEIVSECMTFP